jgi:hypothetical protein
MVTSTFYFYEVVLFETEKGLKALILHEDKRKTSRKKKQLFWRVSKTVQYFRLTRLINYVNILCSSVQ